MKLIFFRRLSSRTRKYFRIILSNYFFFVWISREFALKGMFLLKLFENSKSNILLFGFHDGKNEEKGN